jgi:hypothetical protein
MIKLIKMKWAEHVANMNETRNLYENLVENPEGKIPLQRSRRGWRIILK